MTRRNVDHVVILHLCEDMTAESNECRGKFSATIKTVKSLTAFRTETDGTQWSKYPVEEYVLVHTVKLVHDIVIMLITKIIGVTVLIHRKTIGIGIGM